MAFTPAKWPRKLRSQEWFGGTEKDAIYHRSWMKNQGLPADLPAIVVSGGPMLNGHFRGERVGSGTHLWKFSEAVRASEMTAEEFVEAQASMSRSPSSCNTMGTASTMASMAEALGMALSGNAAIPAVDSRRRAMSHITGRPVVQNGDMIELDVEARRIHLDITDEELKSRMDAWSAEKSGANLRPESGYTQLYQDRVLGADTDADFDFLVGCRGNAVGKEAH